MVIWCIYPISVVNVSVLAFPWQAIHTTEARNKRAGELRCLCRLSPLAHPYQVWSTSIYALMSWACLANSRTHKHGQGRRSLWERGGHVSQYLDRGDTITNPPPSLLSSVLQLYWRCQDTAVRSLRCCHGLSKYGLSKYLLFECVLLNGQITGTDADGLDSYPELDIARLAVQLAMFKLQFSYQTLHEAKARLQGMTTEVRTMFSEVEQLVRLMLLCPVSSCEAERSFSCLRRLKTWLRSTMTQQRLNSIIVCHVNQEVLDSLPISAITAEFAGRSDIQRSVFAWERSLLIGCRVESGLRKVIFLLKAPTCKYLCYMMCYVIDL